jgi:hypothetical protein
MGDQAALPDAHRVGASASPFQGAWRVRFFVSVSPEDGCVTLQHLDDVREAAKLDEPCACVDVECVLPDGSSVEFSAMPADDTVAHVKTRLHAGWTTPEAAAAAPAEACAERAAVAAEPAAADDPAPPPPVDYAPPPPDDDEQPAMLPAEEPFLPPQDAVTAALRPAEPDDDELDSLFLEFKLATARGVPPPPAEQDGEQAAAPAVAAAAHCSAPAEAACALDPPAALADAPVTAEAEQSATPAPPALTERSRSAEQAPAAVHAAVSASPAAAPQRVEGSELTVASSSAKVVIAAVAAPATPRWLPAASDVLAAVSWACTGAGPVVGAWQPAAHLAALCTVVALLVTLCGYTAFCTLAVAVMYARVLHDTRAREEAQAQAAQMRAEVTAAHRQIAATVAALARADESCAGGVRNRGVDEDAEWWNAALAACWTGWLAAWLSSTLSAAVSDGLRQKSPPGLEDIALTSLAFDDTPPRLSAPRMLQRSHNADADGELTLTFGLSLLGEVALHLRLAARVSLLRANLSLPVVFRATEADVRVTLAFIQTPPYVRRVRVSLVAPPRIAVICRPFGALGALGDVGVDLWVKGALEGALRRLLVEPNGHEWDVERWWLEQKKREREREQRATAGW